MLSSIFFASYEIINEKTTKKEGNENITKIGDKIKCPKCRAMSRVVWISKDGKTAGVQCPAIHSQLSRPNSQIESKARPLSKAGKNMIFIIENK